MSLADIRERFRDQIDQSKRQIQESTAYIVIKEKYDHLPQNSQKLVLILTTILALVILLLLPVSLLSSASSNLDDFEEKKGLARSLLKTQRELKQGPPIPPPLAPGAVESRIRSSLNSSDLLPEQIGEIQRVPAKVGSKVPSGITTQGFLIKLSKLNLQQIVDIGYKLQRLTPSTHLTQLNIRAAEDDDHYYHTQFEVTSYSIPIIEEPKEEKKTRKRRRSRRSRGGS